MAANDYYNDATNYYRPDLPPSNNHYEAYSSKTPYSSSTIDHTFGPTEHTPSNADLRFYESSQPPEPPKKEPYSDSIPMKPSTMIRTSVQDFSKQDTQYPPSPENHTNSELLRPRRKKKGFFSGKIPWVVYTATLVQITVFIVEIIKNCTCSSPSS